MAGGDITAPSMKKRRLFIRTIGHRFCSFFVVLVVVAAAAEMKERCAKQSQNIG